MEDVVNVQPPRTSIELLSPTEASSKYSSGVTISFSFARILGPPKARYPENRPTDLEKSRLDRLTMHLLDEHHQCRLQYLKARGTRKLRRQSSRPT
jgi:hypothetical protein